MNPLVHATALKIIALSDRGEITLSAVEKIISECVARSAAAEDSALAGGQSASGQ
jgi:hypothetical protein